MGGDAAADNERAGSFGSIYLAAVYGHEVGAKVVEVNGQIVGSLAGVGVQEHFFFMQDFGDLLYVLHGSDFVIGVDDRGKNGFGGYGFF